MTIERRLNGGDQMRTLVRSRDLRVPRADDRALLPRRVAAECLKMPKRGALDLPPASVFHCLRGAMR